MLKDIFEELYTSEDSKFLNLIKEYALKKMIKKYLILF